MKPLRVLMVEDSEDDALLVKLELRRAGYEPHLRRVETADALRAALGNSWDVIISDYSLPRFDGMQALRVVRELAGGDVPFVLVSGTIGEEKAVEALKLGAGDFVTKQNLTRLVPAIEREIRDAQVRRERRETLEALEAAVLARDRFLSIASHELKTPLTSLQLHVQSLQRGLAVDDLEPERIKEKLGKIWRATERLSELVERLLDVTRIGKGPVELDLEEFDLVDLARDIVTRLREPLGSSAAPIAIISDAPARGLWDRMRLDALLSNLLSNALKYGEGKPIEIRIDGAGSTVHLSVTDHGIGIAPADHSRIFGRFERAVPDTNYSGFGVGLWVARLVAEAHGGRLDVQSSPGSGATFVLDLPRQELVG